MRRTIEFVDSMVCRLRIDHRMGRLTIFFFALPLFLGAAEPKFRMEEIDNKVGVGYGAQLADMNGDGTVNVLDIVQLVNLILND